MVPGLVVKHDIVLLFSHLNLFILPIQRSCLHPTSLLLLLDEKILFFLMVFNDILNFVLKLDDRLS